MPTQDSDDFMDTMDGDSFEGDYVPMEKASQPLHIRREIERRLELSRMRDQLGMDGFELEE